MPGEWRLLLERPVYVVAADARFVDLVRRYFADIPGAENILPRVVGVDPLDDIPADAPVYLTAGARERLGDRSVPGRILPSGRFLSTSSARDLAKYLVEANLRASSVLEPLGSE